MVAKKIVISGYYGFNNSGDEAVLQALITALREQGKQAGIDVQPIVLSASPADTAAHYGVEAVHRMRPREVWSAIKRSDGLISGGGSLLQDVTSWRTVPYYLAILRMAQSVGKPTFIYSQGVGPIQRRLFHPLLRSVLNRCRYVSVRDTESAAFLRRLGVRDDKQREIHVVPDPVMGLAGRMRKVRPADRLPVIGVSLRFWNADRSDLDAVAEALNRVCAKRAVTVRFLNFHLPADVEAARYVADRLKHDDKRADGGLPMIGESDPLAMIRQVGDCDHVLGMRLHSLIYAAAQHVTVTGVSYDPKVDHFLASMKDRAACATAAPSAEAIAGDVLRKLETGYTVEEKAQLDELVSRAMIPAQHICQFLRI